MLRKLNRYAVLAIAAGLFTVACSDDDAPVEQLPTTYNFTNVNYEGQLQRIQMLDMLVTKAKSAASSGSPVIVTKAELEGIYKNANGQFFETTKNIYDKVYNQQEADVYLTLFQQVEDLSRERDLLGNNPNIKDKKLISPNGVEPAQLIAKGLMGSFLYWQAVGIGGYLGEDKMNADNTTVVEGQGTALQHHWDEAFGYFGAPKNYLETYGKDATTPSTKAWFWAAYANELSDAIDVRPAIFNAFIKGRDAINRKDMKARDEAIVTIRENWDMLAAAATLHYINASLNDIAAGNNVALYHHWSEGRGFANALKYNPSKKISIVEHAQLMELLGSTPTSVSQTQLKQNLETAYTLLQGAYKFTDAQLAKL